MTTASELFYTRRSRLSRNSLDLGLDSSGDDRIFHHHSVGNRRHHHYHHHSTLQNHNINNGGNNTRRDHRHDLDGCDPLRRSPLVRHQPLRFVSERDTVRLEEGNSQSSSGNVINLDNLGVIPNSHRFSGNDRLPGAVLLARERLLERLRGVSLSRNRRSNSTSPAGDRIDLLIGDDFRLADAGDWETDGSSEWLTGSPLVTDSTPQIEQLLVPLQRTTKRPPGLTQVELNCLQLEVFSQSKRIANMRSSQECSICLESFVEGDELMCLPCAHKFHSSCLDPWVRVCGDCPCCRRGIVCE